MTDIVLGIKLKYDGKDVTGGLAINRDQFRQIAIEGKRAGEATAGGFTSAAQGVRSMSAQLDEAKRAVVGYLGVTQAAAGARWVLDQASAMTQLDARLKVATASASEYARAQAGVFEVANRWGASVEQTAGAFARLNPVLAQLGGNSGTTLKMLDGLGASLRLSGATAGETSSVMLQFAQAMGSGRVGGDEFRSMMENAEPLMRAVGVELGKTTAELRQMAEEGTLTSSVFGNALLPAIEKLKAKAEQIPLGIGQAWQVLQNNLKRDFGREFSEQETVIGRALKGISDNSLEAAAAVHAMADAVVVLGQASLVAGAGASGLWIAKQGQAAVASTQAFIASRAARIADTQAAELQTAADVQRAQTTLALMTAEREKAVASLAANNATIRSTASVGAHSAALRFGVEAAGRKSAALLMLADASRIQSIATRDLVAAEAAHAAAQARSAAATSIGAGASGIAGRAVAALGGTIPALSLALTAGATAWAIWGGAAESAGDKAKKSIDAALERADRRAKEAKYGAGEVGQDVEALTNVQWQLGEARRSADTAIYEHIRESAREDVRKLESEEKRIKASMAQAEKSSPSATADKPLSAAGEWGKLTESLEWRAKIVKKFDAELVSMEKAHADRMREASAPNRPAIQAEYAAALAAKRAERQAALDALPDAKEGKAVAEAAAEARVRSAEVASKRVLEVLEREHAQYRLSTAEYLDTMAAVKGNALAEQIGGLQAKLAAASKESERIPLREKIKELQAQLDALPADTAAAFEEAADKANRAMLKMAEAAGKAAGPLAQAGAKFVAAWGEDMQQAAADGNQAMIEMGRSAWENMAGEAQFTEAKQRFEELFAEMTAELERVRQVAEQDGGVLAALDADGQAAIIKDRFIPQLRAARAEMEAMRRESPVNGKAVADAGREIERVSAEVSPFWRNFFGEMHQGLTTELMRSARTDGRSFGESFVDGMQDYFNTATLKLGVQMVGDLAIGGVKSAMGLGGGQGGGNAMSSANSAYSLFNNFSATPFSSALGRASSTGIGQNLLGGGVDEAGYAAAVLRGEDVTREAFTYASTEFGQAAQQFAGAVDAYGGYVNAAYQLSEGSYGAAIGSAVGQYFGGPIGAFIGNMLGGLLDGGGGGQKVVGRTTYDPIGNAMLQPGQAGYEYHDERGGKAMADAIALQLGESIQAAILKFGGNPNGYGSRVYLSQDPDGDAPSEAEAGFLKDGKPTAYHTNMGRSQEDFQKAFETQTTRALLGALSDADLADWADAIVDSIDPATASVEQMAAAMAQLDGMSKLVTVMESIGLSASNMSTGLVDALGGFDAAAGVLDSYYAGYFTEEEKAARLRQQITEQLAAVNLTMPETRDELRAMAEAAGKAGEAGAAEFAALMRVQGAFAELVPVIDAVTSAAAAAAAAQQPYLDAVAAAQTDLIASYRDELSVKTAIASRMSGYVQSLTQLRNSLLVGNLSPLSPRAQYDEARRQLSDLKTHAALGDDAAYEQLQAVSQSFLEASQAYNASSAAYEQDFAWVQSILADSSTTAARIAAAAQSQASALQSQISLLDANVRATLSVVDAVGAMQAAVVAAIIAGAPVSDAVKQAAGTYTSGAGATYNIAADTWTSADGTQSATTDALRGAMQGRVAAGGMADLYAGLRDIGMSLSTADSIGGVPSIEQWARDNGLPAFANGGDHAGGLRVVGERGWEVEATGPARYWSHDQAVNMLSRASDPGSATSSKETVTELRRQTDAIERLNGLLETLIARGDSAASSDDIRGLKQHLAYVLAKAA